jgi:spermidine/putrescine-binding protein
MRYRWIAIVLAGAMVLAGCGREVGGDGAAGTGADEGGEQAAGDGDAEPPECEVDEVDGDLQLFNWSDYMDPDLLTAFGEEYGVGTIEDTYTSNEALLAQIRAGAADYDVIVPSDYMVKTMIDEGLLLPLEHDAIPNRENLDDDFVDPPYDEGLRHSMPYQWGTTGIGVDTEAAGPDPEPTWGWLFDPELAGALPSPVSMLDDPRETMGAALYYLGHDPNTEDEAELEEAAALIAEAGAWTLRYESDQYADLLVNGDVAVSHGYNGTYFDAFGELDDPDRYAFLIPEEGATVWTDNLAILANTDSPCTAHTFLNFILDAENGAQLSNFTYYATPNEAAMEFLDEELVEDETVFPSDETWENLRFLENTGDAEQLYTDLFTRAQG